MRTTGLARAPRYIRAVAEAPWDEYAALDPGQEFRVRWALREPEMPVPGAEPDS